MKLVGIICIIVGLIFGILHTINGNAFGILTAVIAFICGLVTVLTNQRWARNKENNENGRERATLEVKLDFILDSLNELKEQINKTREEDEKNKNKITNVEKTILKHSMRLNAIEKELGITNGDGDENE